MLCENWSGIKKIKYIAMYGETSMQDKFTTERKAIKFLNE
jgi:hypothetical protein